VQTRAESILTLLFVYVFSLVLQLVSAVQAVQIGHTGIFRIAEVAIVPSMHRTVMLVRPVGEQ